MQRDIADVRQDLLPQARLCAAADDAQLADLLLFPHDIQDLTQPAGRTFQNSAQEMLPLVGRIHAEEHTLRLCVKHR